MADIIFGIILGGVSIWVYLQARTFPRLPAYPGPGFFPTILAFLLLSASVCLIGLGIRKLLKEGHYYSWRIPIGAGNFFSTIAMVLLYLFLSPRIGFFLSSVLALLLLMVKLRTRVWLAFLVAIAVAALLRILFQGALKVPLPYGPLPGGW